MKPKLKPPETQRSKLKYGEPLSTSGFKVNLRRYITDPDDVMASLKAELDQEESDVCPAGAYTRPHFRST
jgi:hypothetical protein